MSSLPHGWRSVPLKDLGTWLSGGTPSTDEPRYWDGDLPWISAASMKDFRINDSDRRITELGAMSGTRVVPKGSVIFVVRGMSLKSEFRVGITQRRVAFGQDCKAILPAPDVDGEFLALALKARTPQILAMVDEAGHGTGRLPTDLISKLTIDVPPLLEQQNIVEIINSTEGAITSTELLIHKEFLIETSIAERMFEDQIFERSSIVEAASSERGSTAIGPFGSDLLSSDYKSSGVPVAFVQDIRHGEFRHISKVFVSADKAKKLSAHVMRAGDLLVTKMGDPPGIAVAYPDGAPDGIITADIIRIRPNTAIVNVDWLAFAVNNEKFRSQVRAITGGVTRAKITLADIRKLRIPLPPLSEQFSSVALIASARNKRLASEATLAKLRLARQGLMEDLLSGRVRVNPGR